MRAAMYDAMVTGDPPEASDPRNRLDTGMAALTSRIRVVHLEPGGAPDGYRDVATEFPVIRVDEDDDGTLWVVIDADEPEA